GLEPREPVVQEPDETFANGARLHVDLGQRRGEEAAAASDVLRVADTVIVRPDPDPSPPDAMTTSERPHGDPGHLHAEGAVRGVEGDDALRDGDSGLRR